MNKIQREQLIKGMRDEILKKIHEVLKGPVKIIGHSYILKGLTGKEVSFELNIIMKGLSKASQVSYQDIFKKNGGKNGK